MMLSWDQDETGFSDESPVWMENICVGALVIVCITEILIVIVTLVFTLFEKFAG
jgi:hypothetical protein